MAALIPFAIDKETGAIKEIGDVPGGKKCGCICPSCRAGLVARQGSEKEWHFAHDHRAGNRPDRKCDISFESACRLFVIDLLKSGQIPRIGTPGLGTAFTTSAKHKRTGKNLGKLVFVDSEEYEDVKSEIDGYVLEIFLDYKSRARPEAPREPNVTGVLAFPVTAVRARYAEVRGRPRVLAEIVKSIFAAKDGGKRWLHHPAIRKTEPPAESAETGAISTLSSEPNTRAGWKQVTQSHSGTAPGLRSSLLAPSPKTPKPRAYDEKGSFKCYRCDYTWEGGEVSGRVCLQCGSNRHSVFRPH